MKTILSFEACELLVRELSEHQRRRDPAARSVAAGPWPPAPLQRQTMTWQERDDHERFFLKTNTPQLSAWERAVR